MAMFGRCRPLLAALSAAAVGASAEAFAPSPPPTVASAASGSRCARRLALPRSCANPLLHRRRRPGSGRRRGRGGGGGGTELRLSLRPALDLLRSVPRGGAASTEAGAGAASVLAEDNFVVSKLGELASTPSGLFRAALVAVGVAVAALKFAGSSAAEGGGGNGGNKEAASKDAVAEKPAAVRSLQLRFLAVFWLLRCADWLQGPYFYEVYASKVFRGVPASLALVSRLFLTGFASTALFGPLVGRLSDQHGRKTGTLAFSVIYALGAASTKSPILAVLLLGRVMSGIGTSLLFSAPESWLVGEALKTERGGDYLGETFGLAYAGDSIVAILAGQLAGAAAGARGPTGPFELSVAFLAAGGVLTSLLWGENKAESTGGDGGSSKPTIREAIDVVRSDPKISLVGAVQSLFEAAMYVFVLQWPPAVSRAVASAYGANVPTPYGAVFSCFMACCLLGSTAFGRLAAAGASTEGSTSAMLLAATVAMGGAAVASASAAPPLAALVAAFFAFEACVGMYFPSIGTLRSKYVPDSHRSVIMNLFGIPLNVLVVTVFLSIRRLGVDGALGVSTAALGLACACMLRLRAVVRREGPGEAGAAAAA